MRRCVIPANRRTASQPDGGVTPGGPPPAFFEAPIIAIVESRNGAKRKTFMKPLVLLLVSLFVVFLSTGCGPSDAEKRARQVAQAKDDALKLRQQLAQAKSGADAENVRQQIMKVLSDASLTVESIHFTEVELEDYVKAASLNFHA